jgi:magnesium-transporting ATPase (P-type)
MATRIRLKHGQRDRILPRDFFKVLFGQYFPILSITYVASILGMAVYEGGSFQGAFNQFMEQTRIYNLALWISVWVSVPGMIWIFLKGSVRFPAYANAWYIVTAILMVVTLVMSLVLFPEKDGGIRNFVFCALPIHIFMYLFLCKFKLSQWVAQPFQFIAAVLLIYGFLL